MQKLLLITTLCFFVISCDSSKQSLGGANGSIDKRLEVLEKRLEVLEKEHNGLIIRYNEMVRVMWSSSRDKFTAPRIKKE